MLVSVEVAALRMDLAHVFDARAGVKRDRGKAEMPAGATLHYLICFQARQDVQCRVSVETMTPAWRTVDMYSTDIAGRNAVVGCQLLHGAPSCNYY